jgi:hypothetical protein
MDRCLRPLATIPNPCARARVQPDALVKMFQAVEAGAREFRAMW